MTNKQIRNNNKIDHNRTQWTPEQQAAISTSGCNLLVAAAAGAGKTAVLVERIIKKITDVKAPIDIDKLLIVTFTNAAATEMRERIGDAIAKALEKNPTSKQLQRQMTLLHKASITTIHSFCLEVIKNHFHCIDLDPNFRIANDTEALLMKMESLEVLFEEKYEDDQIEETFIDLVESYGGKRDDQMLQDMVFELHRFVQSFPWPNQWLYERVEDFNLEDSEDFGNTIWAKTIIESMKLELQGLLNTIRRGKGIIQSDEALSSYLPNFQEDEENIQILLRKCDSTWDEIVHAISAIEFKRLSRCGKNVDKLKQEQVKGIRNDIKNKIKKMRDDIFANISREINTDLQKLYPMLQYMMRLVMEFDEKYRVKKKEKSLLDFNDLEHYCLQILTDRPNPQTLRPSKVACEYQERFHEIFIDEYQDSNLVQEVMLDMISKKEPEHPNLFMVGDVKQSIYRFRQARPDLFLEKYNTYGNNTEDKNKKIQLYKNFRSRKEIVSGINYIFKQIMSKIIGELDYDENEALNLGAQFDEIEDVKAFTGGEIELHIIDMNDKQVEANDDAKEELEQEEMDKVQTEARFVANKIKELMRPNDEGKMMKIYDKKIKKYRTVTYKDIVILLRATRNWSEQFMEELSGQGIPAYADTSTGYFKTIEVQVIMALLQVIDNPMQDIPLLSVLRSPIASFTPEELIDIRLSQKESSFYEAMQKFVNDGSETTVKKAASILQKLEEWRNKALHMSTDELLWYLYTDTGYYSYVGAMPAGLQRQANLRILFERARQYEETSYKGLFNFINFINRLKSSSGDMGSAKILGENDDVVRIMSIHKSKGLEFPIVIAAGMGKRFNLMDMNKSILLHQKLGFGPEFVDYKRRIAYPTIPKQALKTKIKIESLSEEMRVLYVAFTRAKEKLIITGTVKNIDNVITRWSNVLGERDVKLPTYEVLQGKGYLDWIGLALMRHKDGEILRKYTENSTEQKTTFIDDDSSWDIQIWGKKDIWISEKQMEQMHSSGKNILEAMEKQPIGRYAHDIYSRLEWAYPYQQSAILPTKMSVTELKRQFNMGLDEATATPIFAPPLVKKPMFLEGRKGYSAAEKGTILHAVMQHINIEKSTTALEIEGEIQRMVVNDLLTEQQAQTVDIKRVVQFFLSSLGQRMLKADKIKREIPFHIELNCTEVYKELSEEIYGEETILLQGVIDCYFEEKNDIILIDYKTDYVSEDNIDIIREKYRIQIDYYAKALEQITGKKVKEKNIYLFWNGKIIKY